MLLDSQLGDVQPGRLAVWHALAAIGVLAIVGCRGTPRRDALSRWATVLVLFPVAGSLHARQHQRYQQAGILQYAGAADQPAVVEGTIDVPAELRRHPLADLPGRERPSWQTQLEINLERVRLGRRMEPCDGRALLVVSGRSDQWWPGDVVRVYGTMRRFTGPTNPGQTDFRRAYQTRGLHVRIDVDSSDQVVLVREHPPRWRPIGRAVAWLASAARERLLRHTGAASGPLAVALVIGQRESVDPQTRDLLLVTGTAHLLSVSGLHLAIVVVLANWIATLLRMPLPARIVWILAVCALYTAITGGQPPVIRAAVLVGTLMFAVWMRRPSQPINTLSLAALILVFSNPDFVFSVGVQLSFLAVATLMLCGHRPAAASPAAEQLLRQERQLELLVHGSRAAPLRFLRSAASSLQQLIWLSACVTAISMPLVWHQFHVVSAVSVIANVLIGPWLFVALAAGIATAVCGMVCDPLAAIPGFICHLALQIIRTLIEWTAAVPLGHFWLPSPPGWWVACFYGVIGATLLLAPTARSSWLRYAWIAVWLGIAWVGATTGTALHEGSLEATFIDVGHGTSVAIRFTDRDVWLYDCGRLANHLGSSQDIDETLWSMGVTRLRGIVLSHADADHFNALPGLLERFTVEEILTPPGMLQNSEPAVEWLRDAIARSGTPVRELSAGGVFTAGGHTACVMHPPPQRLPGSDNANSLVLQIQCGERTMLLPGDLEPPGTERLIGLERPPAGGVLMAPHHGSLAADAASVLQWARPREAIVSGGRRAGRPEVQRMLAATGAGVHVTSQLGAIRIRIDRQGSLEVRSWVAAPW